jgi:RNA polymerase sigma-70 factor (ECF subfamily)
MSAPLAAARPTPTFDAVAAELAAHRDHLLRFALRRLHDPAAAEDLVHDVFEAVLARRAGFAGRSALRTWLTGVLKHKIVDWLRQRRETQRLDDGTGDGADGTPGDVIALACPQPLPDEVAEQRERLRHTLGRIEALPPSLRSAVHARLIEDEPTESVCRRLGISETNLFVRLHRARRALGVS